MLSRNGSKIALNYLPNTCGYHARSLNLPQDPIIKVTEFAQLYELCDMIWLHEECVVAACFFIAESPSSVPQRVWGSFSAAYRIRNPYIL